MKRSRSAFTAGHNGKWPARGSDLSEERPIILHDRHLHQRKWNPQRRRSPLRISEMKKSNGLLLQIDIERDPDFQLRLDADDVWIYIKKKHARAGLKNLAISNLTENAVKV